MICCVEENVEDLPQVGVHQKGLQSQQWKPTGFIKKTNKKTANIPYSLSLTFALYSCCFLWTQLENGNANGTDNIKKKKSEVWRQILNVWERHTIKAACSEFFQLGRIIPKTLLNGVPWFGYSSDLKSFCCCCCCCFHIASSLVQKCPG